MTLPLPSASSLRVERDVVLLCSGREPTTGLIDGRYILRGDSSHPDVRIWPGFRTQRSVVICNGGDNAGERQYVCCCSIKETNLGAVYVISGNFKDSEALTVVGRSMTGVARDFLERLLREGRMDFDVDENHDPVDDVDSDGVRACSTSKYVKGPHFFGLRTAGICSRLDIKNFPSMEGPQTCFCADENVSVDDLLAVFAEVPGVNEEVSVRWNGIMALGEALDDSTEWTSMFCGKLLTLRKGFKTSRDVLTASGKWRTVLCEVSITDGSSLPFFRCSADMGDGSAPETSGSHLVTCAVRGLLKGVDAVTKHHWAADFFGFNRPSVQSILAAAATTTAEAQKKRSKSSSSQAALHPIVTRLTNIRHQGAGPTSTLKRRIAEDRRNETVHEIVAFASLGDVKSYIQWLASNHPSLMDEALTDAIGYCNRLTENLAAQTTIRLSEFESAELLLGRAQLSQRAYKALKKTLKKKNVYLASYKKTVKCVNELQIGSISGSCSSRQQCMCALTDFKETMKLIFSQKELFEWMHFPTPDQQKRLLEQLSLKYPELYKKALEERPNNRTIFLRETGDNFRGAARQLTEQDSFTILNLQQVITSPAGQFVNGIWQGAESRTMLIQHLSRTYAQMLTQYHKLLTLPDGTVEKFNVIIFYVADYSHKNEVLGRVAVNGKYGCMHCKKPIDQWGKLTAPAPVLTTKEMVVLSAKAERELGPTLKDSKEYERFHQAHFGQTGRPLLSCFSAECNLSCSLHTILALHRQLWKYVDHIISARGQAELLPDALRSAGCKYMAFQMESYFKSKEKRYDGNDHVRMTGEDCRQLEVNIMKFVQIFCRGKPLQNKENRTLENVVSLYSKFHDLAHDLRSTSGNMQRAKTFKSRVHSFIQLFQRVGTHDCTKRVMYVHALLDHIPTWIVLWCDLMKWGYGVFTTTSGEHLNKQLKLLELGHSDFSGARYQQLLRLLRVRMFHFTSLVLDDPSKEIKCSRCSQTGHTKKNKCSPLHPSQPALAFSDSDGD